MSWGEEQDRATLDARLFHSSPEVVFQALKERSTTIRVNRGWGPPEINFGYSKTLEAVLLDRNDPLINLGPVCFGTNKEVLETLYRCGRGLASDAADNRYKKALRIGCLSNQTIWTGLRRRFEEQFPTTFIGLAELRRIIFEGERDEVEAFICNPTISEELLEELYRHAGAFAELPDDRWRQLVAQSGRNERLNKDNSDIIGPDMGHFRIHEAIVHLLETAPAEEAWLLALRNLIDHLDPDQVAHPEHIDRVLSRWKSVQVGEHSKGRYTDLSSIDEFRCLIAALYGRFSARENADSSDVAVRCGYYSKSMLTPEAMRLAYERDKDVYLFAALNNTTLILRPDTGEVFEGQLTEYFRFEYLKCFERLKRKHPDMRALGKNWIRKCAEMHPDHFPAALGLHRHGRNEVNEERLKRIDVNTSSLQAKLGDFIGKGQIFQANFQTFALIAAIGAALVLWLKK